MWAQAFRIGLRIRANNTNNYAEAAMKVLKDSILQRSKAFNVPQLLDFILCRFEGFYQRRLLSVVNQRPLKWNIQTHNRSKISKDDISKVNKNLCKFISIYLICEEMDGNLVNDDVHVKQYPKRKFNLILKLNTSVVL